MGATGGGCRGGERGGDLVQLMGATAGCKVGGHTWRKRGKKPEHQHELQSTQPGSKLGRRHTRSSYQESDTPCHTTPYHVTKWHALSPGSTSFSILTQFRSTAAASFSAAANTIPGLSSNLMFLSRCTSCTPLVTPGVLPTCGGGHTRVMTPRSALLLGLKQLAS